MYSKLQLALRYLSFYRTASNGKGHGIHSPFVFDFVTKVLNDKKEYSDYGIIESLRQRILQDRSVLAIHDYGAGSSVSKSNLRSVASIARHAVKQKKYGQLLYRIVKYYQPQTIIELGTSLGITTSYLSLPGLGSNLFTLEGAFEVANMAKNNFQSLELKNIKLVEGNFDYTLPSVIYYLSTIDLAFIDGNHRCEPTKNYFHWLLEKTNNNSILIFDDIHWSQEMEQAWDYIRGHPAVRCSIDLFFIGIVLFRHEFREKQHFAIRF